MATEQERNDCVYALVRALFEHTGPQVSLLVVRLTAVFLEATGGSAGLGLLRSGVVAASMRDRMVLDHLDAALAAQLAVRHYDYDLHYVYPGACGYEPPASPCLQAWREHLNRALAFLPVQAPGRLGLYAATACGLKECRRVFGKVHPDTLLTCVCRYYEGAPGTVAALRANILQIAANITGQMGLSSPVAVAVCHQCQADLCRPLAVRCRYTQRPGAVPDYEAFGSLDRCGGYIPAKPVLAAVANALAALGSEPECFCSSCNTVVA